MWMLMMSEDSSTYLIQRDIRHAERVMEWFRRFVTDNVKTVISAHIVQRVWRRYKLRKWLAMKIVRRRLLAVMDSEESKQKIFNPDRLRWFLSDDNKRRWRLGIDFEINK